MDPDDQNQNDTTYTPADDDAKHQKAKPPSVTGEEDAFSGDMPAEPPDIDEELEKVGLKGDDEEGIKPLGVASELQEEEE